MSTAAGWVNNRPCRWERGLQAPLPPLSQSEAQARAPRLPGESHGRDQSRDSYKDTRGAECGAGGGSGWRPVHPSHRATTGSRETPVHGGRGGGRWPGEGAVRSACSSPPALLVTAALSLGYRGASDSSLCPRNRSGVSFFVTCSQKAE